MNIAYVRVSTVEQNEGRQVEALKKHNIDKWFIEKVSGKDTNRVKLQEMLEFVREGDTIYIHDFSRMARSTKDLLNIVELLKEKKVNLVSNKENTIQPMKTSLHRFSLAFLCSYSAFTVLSLTNAKYRAGIR